MDARQAIYMAKEYVEDVFGLEGVSNIGLEEIVHEPDKALWRVTIGFVRRWDAEAAAAASTLLGRPTPQRTYKVVEIDDGDEEVIAVRNRPDQGK